MLRINRNKKGFTLIELLIVVAIIGIIAAIAIPNLLNAIQRGKQKRTMADMRTIGTAVEQYQIDMSLYPAAGYTPLNLADASAIAAQVAPTYVKQMPAKDGWANSYYYGADAQHQAYQIASYGKDGAATTGSTGKTTDFNADIVYEQGSYTVWPEGVQN